eukprot:4855164-Prymnesium_polylepis.1
MGARCARVAHNAMQHAFVRYWRMAYDKMAPGEEESSCVPTQWSSNIQESNWCAESPHCGDWLRHCQAARQRDAAPRDAHTPKGA